MSKSSPYEWSNGHWHGLHGSLVPCDGIEGTSTSESCPPPNLAGGPIIPASIMALNVLLLNITNSTASSSLPSISFFSLFSIPVRTGRVAGLV